MMFGWVEFKIGKVHATAMLTNLKRWRIVPYPEKPWRDEHLGRLTAIAKAPHYPHEGRYGPRQLKEAAEYLDGKAFMTPICTLDRMQTS